MRKPARACQPFMSTPSTRSDVAASPVAKSGLTMSPGTLQTSTTNDPTIAAHWTGASGVCASSSPRAAAGSARSNRALQRSLEIAGPIPATLREPDERREDHPLHRRRGKRREADLDHLAVAVYERDAREHPVDAARDPLARDLAGATERGGVGQELLQRRGRAGLAPQ